MLCFDDSELYDLSEGDNVIGTTLIVHKPSIVKVNNVYVDFIIGEPTEEEIWQRVEKECEFNPEDEIPLNCLITKIIDIMDLGFLANLQLKAVEVTKTVTKRELPTGLKIRVYEKGHTYPSQELVDTFNLEYTAKDAKDRGYGLDIFKSIDFQMIPAGMPNFMLCAIAPRGSAKVDLFSSCKYGKDDKGVDIVEAQTSVLTQGTATFGNKILAMVAETYGVQPKDGFIDLVVIAEHKQVSPNGVYVIPKELSKGDKAGTLTYVTRSTIDVFPFVVDETTAKAIVVDAAEDTTSAGDTAENTDTVVPGVAKGVEEVAEVVAPTAAEIPVVEAPVAKEAPVVPPAPAVPMPEQGVPAPIQPQAGSPLPQSTDAPINPFN